MKLLLRLLLAFPLLQAPLAHTQPQKPTLVAPPCAKSGPWRTAMDRKNIYWTDFEGGRVLKAPLVGGQTVVLASDQKGPCGVAADGTSVYWTNNGDGTVMKVSAGGGSPIRVASGQDKPSVMGLGHGQVFYNTGIDTVNRIGNKTAKALDDFEGPKRSGPTPHCDVCPDRCTRTVCDLNGCREVSYICGWHACRCTQR